MSNNNKSNFTERKFGRFLHENYSDIIADRFVDMDLPAPDSPWDEAFRVDTNQLKAAHFVRTEFEKMGMLDGLPTNRLYWKCKKLILKHPELLEIMFL